MKKTKFITIVKWGALLGAGLSVINLLGFFALQTGYHFGPVKDLLQVLAIVGCLYMAIRDIRDTVQDGIKTLDSMLAQKRDNTALLKTLTGMEDEMLDGDLSAFTEDVVDVAFVNAMVKVVPYVNSHEDQEITMMRLAEVAQMEVNDFYEVISSNLYKSPRMVAQKLRMQRSDKGVLT